MKAFILVDKKGKPVESKVMTGLSKLTVYTSDVGGLGNGEHTVECTITIGEKDDKTRSV